MKTFPTGKQTAHLLELYAATNQDAGGTMSAADFLDAFAVWIDQAGLQDPDDKPSASSYPYNSIDPADLFLTEGSNGPGYLHGRIEIGNCMMHVEAIRVELDGDEYEIPADDDSDNVARLEEFYGMDDGAPRWTEIDGQTGHWLIRILPHRD